MAASYDGRSGAVEEPSQVEISSQDDCNQNKPDCQNKPRHLKFIPVDEFNVGHLPRDCQDKDLVELVRATSILTVRVSVSCISKKRPKDDKRRKNISKSGIRFGTGRVREVIKYQDKANKHIRTCPCMLCKNSSMETTKFAQIRIITSGHGIYNLEEGEHTTCDFFFDTGDVPDGSSDVVTLTGMSNVESNHTPDWCEMTHWTHNLDLADKLCTSIGEYKRLAEAVKSKYDEILTTEKQQGTPSSESISDTWGDLTIIVSHPHGGSKQVSVGKCIEIKGVNSKNRKNKAERDNSWTKYRYTTATSEGSSGAHVFVLKANCLDWYSSHVHKGVKKDIGYSGYGLVLRKDVFQ